MKRFVSKRKYTRFPPDGDTIALISFGKSVQHFSPVVSGLVFDESYGGCGAVFLKNPQLIMGANLIVKVGKLSVMKAEIVWIKPIDEKIMQVGLKYLT